MVTCLVCSAKFKTLTLTHLKKHGLTIKGYTEKFPGAPIISSEISEKLSKNASRLNAARDYSTLGEKISKTKREKFLAGELTPWNKGVPMSTEQKHLIGDKARERMNSAGFTHWNHGKETPLETREKIASSLSESYQTSDLKREREAAVAKRVNDRRVRREARIQSAITRLRERKLELLNPDCVFDRSLTVELQCLVCDQKTSYTRQMIDPCKIDATTCRTCNPIPTTSKGQLELYEFIRELCPTAIINDRVKLGGKEIDVLVPDQMIGFEYNGLYWHSSAVGSLPKHLLWKQQFAHNVGVNLIHIFEDEWISKRDIVKSRIRQILKFQTTRLDARKCHVQLISSISAEGFLLENHLQGGDKAGVRYGLFHDHELVSVMTFKRSTFVKGCNGDEWELSRFAVKRDVTVRGAGGKLLKAFERDHRGDPLITYADRRWGNGKLYLALGFKFSHLSSPGYWYVNGNNTVRHHRSKFMKHKLISQGADPSLTESAIMEDRGFYKIWDCGNLVFKKSTS